MNRRDPLNLVLVTLLEAALFAYRSSAGELVTGLNLTVLYPLRQAYARALHSGSLSLWNPLIGGGYPLLAEGQVAALYPPNLILHWQLPTATALAAGVLLHQIWLAAGLYVLARRLALKPILALALALAAGLASLLAGPLGDANALAVLSWLPWQMLCAHLLLSSPSTGRSASLLALTAGAALLAGQPVLAGAELVVVLLWSAYLLRGRRVPTATLFRVMLAQLLGFGLALPQLGPYVELARLSSAPVAPEGAEGESLATLSTRPYALDLLEAQTGLYRILTRDKPELSAEVQRQALYPHTALLHGLPAASISGLRVPRLHALYSAQYAPNTLNLMGVKYCLIPQAPAAAGQPYDLASPFVHNPLDDVTAVPFVKATAFEIEWYLSEAAELDDGDPMLRVVTMPVLFDEGIEFTLSVGSHTSDWAYDRSDVRSSVRHHRAPVWRTFPARSGDPVESHLGSVYRVLMPFTHRSVTQGIRLQSYQKAESVHIERALLIDEDGVSYNLAHLAGKSDHTLAYRSEYAAIWENHDVLPRAFLAYQARAVADDEQALALLRNSEFNPRREVLLADGPARPVSPPTTGEERVEMISYRPESVQLNVTAPAAGYLVLTDAWYPGWRVAVDGQGQTPLRADVLFRAVYLEPGHHTVEFTYQPAGWPLLLVLASAALLVTLGQLFVGGFRRRAGAAA